VEHRSETLSYNRKIFEDTGIDNAFLNKSFNCLGNNTNRQMRLHQIKEFLHIKGNNYQNEERTLRMGGNLGKLFIKGLISRI
jgi:hypothetical protein